MVTGSQEKKNLRLNNWHLYLLGKLNERYIKGEMCDVTLKFHDDNTSFQAHRLVLSSCASYFASLTSTPPGSVITLPEVFSSKHIKSIINFMYTGKLEYQMNEQHIILEVARKLGMNVLTELLQVQQSDKTTLPPTPTAVPIATKKPPTPSLAVPVAQKKPSNITTPETAIIRQYVQKHVPKQPTPANMVDSTSLALPPDFTPETPTLPGKKLPFWKKRSVTQLPEDFYRSASLMKKPPIIKDEPRPTRFDWPDEETLPQVEHSFNVVDTFEHISYDSKVTVLKPPEQPKPVVRDDCVVPSSSEMPKMKGIKRARVSEVVRGRIDDDDDYDDEHFETIHDLDDSDDESTPADDLSVATPPKPILKTQATPSPNKKVRFSFSGDKSQLEVSEEKPLPVTPSAAATILSSQILTPSVSSPRTITSTVSSPQLTTPSFSKDNDSSSISITSSAVDANNSVNHARIINEIIKKFPNLVKKKGNIKLKIQPGGVISASSPQNSTIVLDKDNKGAKVQYVVVKTDLKSVVKKETKDVRAGAENRNGPWLCIGCGNEDSPLNFSSYYDYRKHLQEVHNERIDARICEHCGFKASKRNLHLYHLYTKHNIAPPRSIHFPKCDQCDYIALSESLLIKHRMNHTGLVNKEFICRICNAAFKSNGALMGHMQTNLHQVDHTTKKDYECEYCGKIFSRNINLKAHVRTSHQEETIRKMYEEEDQIDNPQTSAAEPDQSNQNLMEVIEVPVYDSVTNTNKSLFLPQGMTIIAEGPNVPLLPSSESEAMNNVATGIATSINITDRNIPNDVIVIDGHPDLILQGSQATYVLNQDGSYSLQEYIVPEIMNDTGQVYSNALVSTAPSSNISYVNSDSTISIITSSSDHTYADEVKLNGVISTAPATTESTVVTTQVSTPQAVQPIIVQEPIIVSQEWVQSMASSQAQTVDLGQAQKVEIISAPVVFQGEQKVEIISASTSQAPQPVEVQRTVQKLANDWGDFDEDQDDDKETEESEVKPSRPTIDLDQTNEVGII